MSAPQPIAFIDLDGVCYDFVGAVEARGIEVDRTSVGLGMPPEHLAKLTRDATLYEGPPLPGVTESCERLHGLGFKLVFITSRPNVLDVMRVTLDFVDGIAPEAQTPEVIFSHPLGEKPAIVHRLATPLGNLLKELRHGAGLSQRAAAAAVGVSFPHISKIEAGHEVPSAELLVALAKAYKVDHDGLLLAADRLPEDVEEAVIEKKDLAPQFLRSWRSGKISDEDVRRLLDKSDDGGT